MSQNVQPLQTDDVVKILHKTQECALVHRDTGHEVYIFGDSSEPQEPWFITYRDVDILEKDVLKQALALGFKLGANVCGQYTDYSLFRTCHGITAAAILALALARMLPGVPHDAWLWITGYEYDYREEPPDPPNPWPPLSA